MKVKYYPCQPHCFAFGGFDMQMLNTLEAVISSGVDASKLDIWGRDNDFDIIHVWGVGPYNYNVIDWSAKAGKKIMATVLSPYHDTLRSKAGYYYKRIHVKNLIHYYKMIDHIIVLNDVQKKVLQDYYKVAPQKMSIIPNIIEKKYFEPPLISFSEKYGINDYVLCTGNITNRKNQYNLALACSRLNMKLVLIGKVLDGEVAYGKKLEELTTKHPNILWINELPKASDDLVAAYHDCKLYALPSRNETQPISALEAVAVKKPLLLMNRAYAHQSYYNGAVLCESPSVKSIMKALDEFVANTSPAVPNSLIQKCLAENVGLSYKKCYDSLMGKNG